MTEINIAHDIAIRRMHTLWQRSNASSREALGLSGDPHPQLVTQTLRDLTLVVQGCTELTGEERTQITGRLLRAAKSLKDGYRRKSRWQPTLPCFKSRGTDPQH